MLSTDQMTCIVLLFLAATLTLSGGSTSRKLIESIRSRRLRILVIDDTDQFRESMIFVLTEIFGAVVTAVNSGRDAVELLRAGNAFNVIFLDLIMPNMNGLRTYEELGKVGAACRVLVMSAHPDSKEWEEAESLGVELIEKPIPEEALIAILSAS